jgi:hypothetical protein
VIDTADVFSQQAEADELGADKDKEDGKKGEDALSGPGRGIEEAHTIGCFMQGFVAGALYLLEALNPWQGDDLIIGGSL